MGLCVITKAAGIKLNMRRLCVFLGNVGGRGKLPALKCCSTCSQFPWSPQLLPSLLVRLLPYSLLLLSLSLRFCFSNSKTLLCLNIHAFDLSSVCDNEALGEPYTLFMIFIQGLHTRTIFGLLADLLDGLWAY